MTNVEFIIDDGTGFHTNLYETRGVIGKTAEPVVSAVVNKRNGNQTTSLSLSQNSTPIIQQTL
ncbi:MAG: hypothetical protein LBQ98_00025 [Nitrososphaerota archaeon]|jgi:hypothetical protein|nr:hypothetical protein [Nitrososphaerota archaeon]